MMDVPHPFVKRCKGGIDFSPFKLNQHSRFSPKPLSLFSSPIQPTQLPPNVNNEQNNENEDSGKQCKTCLYTGVATCAFLSAYSFKVALLDLPRNPVTKDVLNHKRLMLGFGYTSILVGAYRFYLG